MLSLVSLALFGTADAQCGITLTQAGPMMMFSGAPASYKCTNWKRVNFQYTGSVKVWGPRGCGAVLYDSNTGSQSTMWSNGGTNNRHYPGEGKRIGYYYLLCPGDSMSRAMASKPGGRRLEDTEAEDLPTLQRRLVGQIGSINFDDSFDESFDEGDALIDEDDFGAEDLWVDDAGLGALDVSSFGYGYPTQDNDYPNNDALNAAADTAGIAGLIGLGELAFGEDMWGDMGEDMWGDMGEGDPFNTEDSFDFQDESDFGSAMFDDDFGSALFDDLDGLQ